MAGKVENPNFSDIPLELTQSSESDRIQSNCGLFAFIDVSGTFSGLDVRHLTWLGIKSQQHRAEGYAGWAEFDRSGKGEFVRGKGLIDAAFKGGELLPDTNDSRIAIAHTRYPTSGNDEHMPNTQPLELDGLTLAHHGNLTNAQLIKDDLVITNWDGEYPTNDSWAALNAISRSGKNTLEEKMIDAQKNLEGGWAFVATDGQAVVAARDPEGIRPLLVGVVGSWENPKAFAVSVESTSFNTIGIIDEKREVLPGETISIRDGQLRTIDLSPAQEQRSCVFEFVYMMFPDSEYLGQMIYEARYKAGEKLWEEQPIEIRSDGQYLIMPVPDSGRIAANGYFDAAHRELGDAVVYKEGILVNKYEGRNFIQSSKKRNPSAKFKIISNIISGNKLAPVDDSSVRGTTQRGLNTKLRIAGAKEIHSRYISPEVINACFWGIDMPTRDELIAFTIPDLRERASQLGADSIGHLSLDGLLDSTCADQDIRQKLCAHCFGGNSPRNVPNNDGGGTIVRVEDILRAI